MKQIVMVIALIIGIYVSYNNASTPGDAVDGDAAILRAFDERRESLQVRGTGTVSRLLSDDNDDSRHQRFILALSSGHTLMVAHNIDLAPRIDSLASGDTVSFYGEYEWNPRGGVIHWTHHDPQGRHVGGWLEHEGQRYQ